jgi:hypothetical protein
VGDTWAADNRMKKCATCILPETYPGIEFNDEGVCSYCLTYKRARYRGENELERLLESFRGKGRRYDCVLGISGGRDSSYALYYLVKKCNLRVLAYTADNGFVPEESKLNMKRITDKLNVDLVVERHRLLEDCIRHNFHSWLRRPSPAMIPMICCGCRLGMFRGLLRCAEKNRVPLVVLGAGTSIEANRFKETFLTRNRFGKLWSEERSKTISLALGLLYEIGRNPLYFLKPINGIVYMEEFLYFFNLETIRKLFYPHQTVLQLFQYVEWREEEILSTVKKELDWVEPGGSTSTWRTDCRLGYLKNYLLKKSVGFTEKDDILSNMTREDMVTREEALRRAESENIVPEKIMTELFKEIEAKA